MSTVPPAINRMIFVAERALSLRRNSHRGSLCLVVRHLLIIEEGIESGRVLLASRVHHKIEYAVQTATTMIIPTLRMLMTMPRTWVACSESLSIIFAYVWYRLHVCTRLPLRRRGPMYLYYQINHVR
jgi:hypothetical protein